MRGLKGQGYSWAAPRLDLGGCVLYLPLWRPDMVARGGSIVSGTGTMAVTPLTLAVGANTVTATGAGTFIITTPVGGTCASGAATITGSPVTLNAGVATSVTTGVTTGAFTVTTSNIIKSKDSTGHLSTITGATWGSQGRTFNGASDKITIPDNAVLKGMAAITIMAWVNTDSIAVGGSGFVARWVSSPVGSDRPYLLERSAANVTFAINGLGLTTTDSPLSAGAFYQISGVYDSAGTHTKSIYVNGAFKLSDTASSGVTQSAETINPTIGLDRIGGSGFFDGIIGEVIVYNRVLSVSELLHIYLKTKWRYS